MSKTALADTESELITVEEQGLLNILKSWYSLKVHEVGEHF